MPHRVLYIAPLLLLLSSCGRSGDTPNLREDRLVAFFADSLVAREEVLLTGSSEETLRPKVDSLYRLHGLTREEMRDALDYYSRHLEAWKAFLSRVVSRLEESNMDAVPEPSP